MKKPILHLKSLGDYLKIALCIALCASALALLNKKESDEAVAVFSQGEAAAPKSLYGHLGSYL